MYFDLNGQFVLDVLLKATVLLSASTLVLLAARRLPAAARHVVGVAGLLAVLALPLLAFVLPSIEMPVLPRLATAEPAAAKLAPSAPPPARLDAPGSRSLKRVTENAVADREPAALEDASEPANRPVRIGQLGVVTMSDPEPIAWRPVLLVIWAAGALLVLARFAAGTWQIRRIVGRATPVQDPAWIDTLNQLSRRLRVPDPPRLFHTEEVSVAMAAGIASPVLLLPEDACTWTADRRSIVLLHELAHVRRRDCLSLLLAALATTVYWFHPLVWIVSSRMRREAERASDDLVLEAGARASDYAAELLAIIRSLGTHEEEPLTALALAEGSDLEGRLRAILDPVRRRRLPSTVAACAGLVALVGFAATVAAVQPWAEPEAVKAVRAMPAAAPQSAIESAPAEPVRVAAPAAAPVAVVQPVVSPRPRAVVPSVNLKGIVFAGRRSHGSDRDWYSRGMSFHNDERWDEAIEAFKKSYEAGEREGASAYNAACGYARKGDADHAFEWLDKAFEEGFELNRYLGHDDDLDSIRSDPRMAVLKQRVRADRAAGKQGEARAAIARLDRLLARGTKDEADGKRFDELGRDLLKIGEYGRSAQAFQSAIERGHRVSTTEYNAACALALGGDKSAALDHLQKSLELGYDDPKHMDKDDDLDPIRGEPRFKELRRMADELAMPNDWGLRNWSKRPWNRSEWTAAASRYQRWLKDHPTSGRAYFSLGFVQIRLGEYAASRDAFMKANELGYRRQTTMYNIACALARLDQKDAAFDWLFKSIDAGFASPGMLDSDADLDNLRQDPRFRKAERLVEDRDGKND